MCRNGTIQDASSIMFARRSAITHSSVQSFPPHRDVDRPLSFERDYYLVVPFQGVLKVDDITPLLIADACAAGAPRDLMLWA